MTENLQVDGVQRYPPVARRCCLKEKGVRYESKVYGDEQTKPPHVFHCDIRSEPGRQANDDEPRFFKSFVG